MKQIPAHPRPCENKGGAARLNPVVPFWRERDELAGRPRPPFIRYQWVRSENLSWRFPTSGGRFFRCPDALGGAAEPHFQNNPAKRGSFEGHSQLTLTIALTSTVPRAVRPLKFVLFESTTQLDKGFLSPKTLARGKWARPLQTNFKMESC